MTEPDFTLEAAYIEVTKDYTVTDAPHHTKRHVDMTMAVDRIRVVYMDGEFQSMRLAGYRVRRDGSIGEQRTDETLYEVEVVPGWARPLLDGGAS